MLTCQRINLHAVELFVVDLAHAAQLNCELGELWLTHDQLSEDFELKQSIPLALPKGKVLIEGREQLHFYGKRAAMKIASISTKTIVALKARFGPSI